MKKYRNYTIFEMDEMVPYQLEIFYYMALDDYRKEKNIK